MTQPRPKSLIPRLFALIPCAGQGSRAIGEDPARRLALPVPKQYQPIAGLPMVQHTLRAFAQVDRLASCLVVVAPEDSFFGDQPMAGCTVAACGGASRADTVLHGLQWLANEGAQPDDWVLVHDAARCLVTPELINRLIDACQHDPVGGLLAQPLPDTLKQASAGRVAATIERSDKWLAQTPQMFRLGALTRAMRTAQTTGEPVTDEASAMEAAGLSPQLVRGSAHNFKVTYPEDFLLAQAVIHHREAARSGLSGQSQPAPSLSPF